MDDLNYNVAVNLKRIRREKGMSLEGMAEQTGVSKSMLAQIEKGIANPSLGVIGKIIGGLQIEFQELIEDASPGSRLVHIKEMEPTKEVQGEYKIWNCFPYENNCMAKIYRIDMEPGAEYTGSSQGEKTRAYISVLEGEVKIRCGEEAYLVGKEDVFCLEMDRQHSYRNDTAKRISLICFFPDCHKRY